MRLEGERGVWRAQPRGASAAVAGDRDVDPGCSGCQSRRARIQHVLAHILVVLGLALFAAAAQAASVSPTSVLPGATLTLTWGAVASPTNTDWVGVYTPGAPDTAYQEWRYTNGQASGSGALNLAPDKAPGTYQVRLFANDGYTRLAVGNNFSVGGAGGGGGIYFIHTDHLNTPRVITNQAGQTVWQWDNLDPFGNNAPVENPSGLGTFTCNLRLPGQYFDRETNLHYNYFRDYDPGIGRYVQSDPIGLVGGINTYAYVDNDPVGYSDPLGLERKRRPRYLPYPQPPMSPSPSRPRNADRDEALVPPGSRDRPSDRPSRELEGCYQECDDKLDRDYQFCRAMGNMQNNTRLRRACEERAFNEYVECRAKCRRECK